MPGPALYEGPGLPPGFEDLLEFVPHWIGETAQERCDIRARATMAAITRFYYVLLSLSAAILVHVSSFPLDSFPSPSLLLFLLLLSLSHSAFSFLFLNHPLSPFLSVFLSSF